MQKIKLNICSLGDPTNPRTWSGTPYNLFSELSKMDCLSSAFNSMSTLNQLKRKLIYILNRNYYNKSVNLGSGLFSRYLNANKVKRATKKSGSKFTLHTGTLDLPFCKLPRNQKHYLFCDVTWDQFIKYSTYTKDFSKKLIDERERIEQIAYLQMEHIYPISEYVKHNLITHYGINPNKLTVVGTGLGVIKPYYGEKSYSNGKILFVAKGNFENKGGFLVLEAFKLALMKNPNLELNIVGQNEYINKINLPNIKTYGYIPINELQEIFNKCSLFLMPAIFEAWGLVYLEAMACKMPIIGLNRNSFPEISDYGNYGFGLDDNNPEKLANIILNAFENPDVLARVGLKAQEYCLNKYSWNRTVSTIIRTIQKAEQ